MVERILLGRERVKISILIKKAMQVAAAERAAGSGSSVDISRILGASKGSRKKLAKLR